MCEPTTIALATMGLGIASGVGGYMSQSAAYDANKKNALEAEGTTWTAMGNRQAQEQTQAATKLAMQRREFAGAQADAVNRASEGGLLGSGTVGALLKDLGSQEDSRENITKQNLQNTVDQLQMQKKGEAINTENRINSVKQPSMVDLALTIGGSALSAGTGYMNAGSSAKTNAGIAALLSRGA